MSKQIDLTDYAESDSRSDSDWIEKRLGEIFGSIYSGGTPKKGIDEYYEGVVPFVKIKDLNSQKGAGVSTAAEFITEQAIEETSARAFDTGTLLLTIYGSLAETAIVRNRVATNQAILGLWDATEDNTLYVRYAIDNTQPRLESLSRQTTQANLGKGIVEKHRLPIPPLKEQRKIASVLYTVDQAIQKNGRILSQTERLKQGVAQSLIREGPGNEGTKQAWMGEVPSSWDIQGFSQIVDFSQNGIYKQKDEYGGDYPIIKMGDIFEGVVLELPITESVHLSEDEFEKYTTQNGDLVFARHAQAGWGAGDCTLVPELERPAVVESNMIQVRLKREVAPMFYAQYFSSSVGTRAMRRITTTSNIRSISQNDLMNLKVPVPPRETQDRIAAVLSAFDDQANAVEAEIERLERLKRGLMQDLLSGGVRTTDADIEIPGEVLAHG